MADYKEEIRQLREILNANSYLYYVLDAPDSAEVFYRILWKRFFDSVSIAPRENPRCQNSFLPKRYRDVMTEFLPTDAGTTPAMPLAKP